MVEPVWLLPYVIFRGRCNSVRGLREVAEFKLQFLLTRVSIVLESA